jgi:hypothetical protein
MSRRGAVRIAGRAIEQFALIELNRPGQVGAPGMTR